MQRLRGVDSSPQGSVCSVRLYGGVEKHRVWC
jgi:hypothetical protein